MPQSALQVVTRWFDEVWNEGREAAMEELLAPHASVHGTGGEAPVVGPAGFKPFYKELRHGFPDIRFTIDDGIEHGETAALRWRARMTHKGDHLGIPATGKTIEVTGMSFVRVRDGKVQEAWNNWDMLTLMHALGQTTRARVADA